MRGVRDHYCNPPCLDVILKSETWIDLKALPQGGAR